MAGRMLPFESWSGVGVAERDIEGVDVLDAWELETLRCWEVNEVDIVECGVVLLAFRRVVVTCGFGNRWRNPTVLRR